MNIRLLIAKAIMWLIQPVLAPMLAETDERISQLQKRKVDWTEVDDKSSDRIMRSIR